MKEKCKYTSLSAIKAKNRRQKISTEEKLDVITRDGKVNELLTHTVMFDSLIAAYVKLVIMLIKLQKMLNQELQCLCSTATTMLLE